MSEKQLLPDNEIVTSLIALRDEMYQKARGDNFSPYFEAFAKMNSCLYRGYPKESPTFVERNKK